MAALTGIEVQAIVAAVKFFAPDDIDVETSEMGFMGTLEHHNQRAKDADALLLRITGLGLGASVEILQRTVN